MGVKEASTPVRLPLIGRDYVLIEKLAKRVFRYPGPDKVTTDLRRTSDGRGWDFEVMIVFDGQPTGHIARVTIEMDRIEQVAVDPPRSRGR